MKQRDFPAKDIKILARRKRTEVIGGVEYPVESASVEGFDGVDIALFAGTEGAKGASRQYGWEAVKKGAVVVDNGDDFRMDPRVPLVVSLLSYFLIFFVIQTTIFHRRAAIAPGGGS